MDTSDNHHYQILQGPYNPVQPTQSGSAPTVTSNSSSSVVYQAIPYPQHLLNPPPSYEGAGCFCCTAVYCNGCYFLVALFGVVGSILSLSYHLHDISPIGNDENYYFYWNRVEHFNVSSNRIDISYYPNTILSGKVANLEDYGYGENCQKSARIMISLLIASMVVMLFIMSLCIHRSFGYKKISKSPGMTAQIESVLTFICMCMYALGTFVWSICVISSTSSFDDMHYDYRGGSEFHPTGWAYLIVATVLLLLSFIHIVSIACNPKYQVFNSYRNRYDTSLQ